MQTVEFQFITGLKRSIFRNVRLNGSWDADGRYSDQWTMEIPMQEITGTDGCPVFTASVSLDLADQGKPFKWGVILDCPQEKNLWGIPTEVKDLNSFDCHREFQLQGGSKKPQIERYYFTQSRHLGANKYYPKGKSSPTLRFGVWAPNAKSVSIVFGDPNLGYIAGDGTGIDPTQPVVELSRQPDGVWEGGPAGNFEAFKSRPYMYRIENAQGETVYRTDIFSRCQIGKGSINPENKEHQPWSGTPDTLEGIVSCSVVIDPDVIRRGFESTPPGQAPDLIPAEEFWRWEFTPGLPIPTRVEDLVIYELHVGSLGFDSKSASEPGDLSDAMNFLDHLVDLGVNAVEMLPMAEFEGHDAWGYGNSHHLCIDSCAGGRDKYRHFVRECHRRGIAVLQDVVYNHYAANTERVEWQYDSTAPEDNIYFWYEGRSSDYRLPDGTPFPDGGYVDNGSSGYSPRFWEEKVRQQFIAGAVFLIEEMHIDGLRVDLTQAIHRDNALHLDGRSVGNANVFGQKFLREWSRTLRMIKPAVMLMAEDHTGWEAVTQRPDQNPMGLGFDAVWEVSFYHHLIGDSKSSEGKARLLKEAGFGGDHPLRIAEFSEALYGSRANKVVYHESHDEAGNEHRFNFTERTLVVAVNGAPLVGPTREAAEARARVSFGLSLLSAGTPMFFMGEEIGAQKRSTYKDCTTNREDILGERNRAGKALFRFYQDIISLSRKLRSIRSHNIDILHHSDDNRVIAFKRWSGSEEVIIVASFNNTAFQDGYIIEKDTLSIPPGQWKEVFNSDAMVYGGRNVGNYGATIPSSPGALNLALPANGFVVLVKQ